MGNVRKGSEYSINGNCAHEIAARCLTSGDDAWEYVGFHYEKDGLATTFDMDDCPAVQEYLDLIRGLPTPISRHVEVNFHCPDIHPQFFGQSDNVDILPDLIDVWDYKHGVGIPVEVEHNTQLMMYGIGAIRELERQGVTVPERVRLNICQPRAFHPDGPVRQWYTTRAELEQWIDEEWLPAAAATRGNNPDLMAGDWCQFCPVRLDCPLMKWKMERVKAVRPEEVRNMTDEELSLLNANIRHLGFVKKAAADETFSRLMNGKTISGSKLVHKKADRVWKEDAEPELVAQYGDDLYEKKIKSPAVIEKMPGGSTLVRKLAYKPETGFTVADASDVRTGQRARSLKEVFVLDK